MAKNIIDARCKVLLNSDDFIVIFPPERTITFANAAYCDFIKQSLLAVVGSTFTERRSETKGKIYTSFNEKLTLSIPFISTVQLMGPSGKEKWVAWKENGIFDEDGVLLEILAIGKIVNKSLEMNRPKLISTLTAFKKAIDTNIICTICDAKGHITYANEKFCSISKYSLDELLGKTHRIVNSKHHPKDFFTDMWRTISGGKMWSGDIMNRAKDGSYYWVQSVIVPIKEESNKITGYLSLRILITERKKMEEEKAIYLKSVEDMLHIVSHEIRKPITTCQGLLNLIEDGTLSTPGELIEGITYLKSSVAELDLFSRKLNDYLYKNIKIEWQQCHFLWAQCEQHDFISCCSTTTLGLR